MKRLQGNSALLPRVEGPRVPSGPRWPRAARQVLVWLLAIPCLSWCDALLAGEDSQKLEEVFAAWSRRQERTRSAKFEWEQEKTGPHIVLSDDQPPGAPKRGETIVVQQPSSLRLDGDRFDYRLRTPDGSRLRIPPLHRSSYDGSVSQRFDQATRPNHRSSGIVTGAAHEFDMKRIYIGPILLTYRAVHPTMLNLKPEDYRLGSKRGIVNGRRCLIIQEKEKEHPPIQDSYWIDPERDYIVLRYVSTVEGRDSILQDISYQHDPRHGWVPSRWKTVFLGMDGSFGESSTCRITDYTINQPIPLEEFQIEFPVGTRVEDRAAGRTYVVEPSAWPRWLWIILPLCVVLVLLLLVARRRRSLYSQS